MATYRTILVGTDGSTSSFGAVSSAASLAAATGADPTTREVRFSLA
ncbi:universal stress protein [Streptosporangium sp. NPDC006013]